MAVELVREGAEETVAIADDGGGVEAEEGELGELGGELGGGIWMFR
jgi:hypothetical protein